MDRFLAASPNASTCLFRWFHSFPQLLHRASQSLPAHFPEVWEAKSNMLLQCSSHPVLSFLATMNQILLMIIILDNMHLVRSQCSCWLIWTLVTCNTSGCSLTKCHIKLFIKKGCHVKQADFKHTQEDFRTNIEAKEEIKIKRQKWI